MFLKKVSSAARRASQSRLVLTASACSLLLLTTGFVANQAYAANSQVSEKVLWSFGGGGGGGDGSLPNAPLVSDTSGNLYGTTFIGGANQIGIVFEVTPAGQESVLWVFGNGDPDGALPLGGLIIDNSGNLYGTTSDGGIYDDFNSDFGGTVFALTPSGQESILWNFGNGADGIYPAGSLLVDASGDLFGTTEAGGVYNGGTAFELTPSRQESVLWNFGNGADGIGPSSALIKDASGNLYGTTSNGGAYGGKFGGGGALFKLTPITVPGAGLSSTTTYTESILWSFGKGADGQSPDGPPITDTSGNFFGTTVYGGSYGVGIVYEVAAGGQESVLWNFGNGSDGQYPNGVIMDASGNLYGITSRGGANLDCGFPATASCGTVYELTPPSVEGGAWTETILYNFGPSPNGYFPSGNLLLDASGNLYGVTSGGGANFNGGTVFELSGAVTDGQIALSSQHIQFPKTSVGGSSSYQLAIRNTGTGQLSGTLATPPAPFGLQGSGSFNLAPHTQTKITLTFKPAAADRVHQIATITSTSVKQNSIQLDLRGIGTAPASPALALNEAPR